MTKKSIKIASRSVSRFSVCRDLKQRTFKKSLTMKFCYYFSILCLSVLSCVEAATKLHNCTSFNDKNHGFGCELRSVKPADEDLEISVMAKDDTNKTEADVTWVQIRDSEFDDNLPKGVFEKFVNMEKIMILSSKGFKNLEISYFDKKIKLILMKNTDLEVVGENCLTGLTDLKILSLNYNKVTKVHKNAFRDLVNLEKIEMVYNNIESLDEDTFENNVNLKLVLLYNNQLKVISAQLFARNVNIESLQLQNNGISQIEKGFHANLVKLTRGDFSSNVCISETILLTRYIQWSSHQYKFKDCYNNYALMKSTNEVINGVQTKLNNLEIKVNDAVETVKTDLKVFEGSLKNESDFQELKTNLVEFLISDKEKFKQTFESDLINITSHVRTEMMVEMEKKVETALGKTQDLKQEKLVFLDFENFRDELSGKFTMIYCILAFMVLFGCVTTFFIFQKLRIFPTMNYNSDNRHLIGSEVC